MEIRPRFKIQYPMKTDTKIGFHGTYTSKCFFFLKYFTYSNGKNCETPALTGFEGIEIRLICS